MRYVSSTELEIVGNESVTAKEKTGDESTDWIWSVILPHDGFSFAIERAKFGRAATHKSPRRTTGGPMRASVRIIISALALVGTAPPLVAQTPPAPIVKVEGLRQISAHVHIIPDNSVPMVPNVGYVVGDRAALVIDTGLGPRNGTAVYEVAKKLAGTKALYLVTTHVHPEHDLGAQGFPDTTTLIRSTDQVKEIAEFGLQLAKVFAGRSPIHAELLKDADFRKADITFERDYDLDLGGVKAKLTAMGPNHTVGDTTIWIEFGARPVHRRSRHARSAGLCEPPFEPSAVALEPRPAGGTQARYPRTQPRPDCRRHRLHHRLSRLPDGGPRPHGR